jgi:hypothetical protein
MRYFYEAAASMLVILLIASIFLGVYRFTPSLLQNVAYVILNKNLWKENVPASERQIVAQQAAWLIRLSLPSDKGVHEEINSCGMIASIGQAEQARRQQELTTTVQWLEAVAQSQLSPKTQKAIRLPGWISISQNDKIVLDWTTPGWFLQEHSQPVSIIQRDDRLLIAYDNTLGKRDIVIYRWTNPFSISYWNTLHLEMRATIGTFVTFSTQGAKVYRHLDYFVGNDDWSSLDIELTDPLLNTIYISLSEPSAHPTTPHYLAEFKSLEFRLMPKLEVCSS